MRARERWLAWNSDELGLRLAAARWHADAGRHAEAERWYREANEVDPMARAQHEAWGRSLLELERAEEALREFDVALAVPHAMDRDLPGPLGDAERARLLGLRALALVGLGRVEEARAAAQEALGLDDGCEEAARALAALP